PGHLPEGPRPRVSRCRAGAADLAPPALHPAAAGDRGGSGRRAAGGDELALHDERVDASAADPVVAASSAALPVAGGGVDGAGAVVVLAHLEQHPLGAAAPGLLLAPGEQGAADALPLATGTDGVEVGEVSGEHDPGIAEQRAAARGERPAAGA